MIEAAGEESRLLESVAGVTRNGVPRWGLVEDGDASHVNGAQVRRLVVAEARRLTLPLTNLALTRNSPNCCRVDSTSRAPSWTGDVPSPVGIERRLG
jgi:hypothetical protein